jgi:pyridoxal phosphate enzyme (YggS family)
MSSPTQADPPDLRAALEAVRARIRTACERAGRDPAKVRLVAVSKTVTAERVRALVDCGHGLLGENRVQEAMSKAEAVGAGATWHLVGHLQRNKARHAVGLFELIHGVDDERLARELDRRAGAAGLRQQVLVQVNLAGEQTKAGVDPEALPALLETVAAMPNLDLRGLMTIPPFPERPEDSRHWFVGLRELRERVIDRLGRPLPDLSMGMTDDFEVAIEEGATLVRVGRAIFGER